PILSAAIVYIVTVWSTSARRLCSASPFIPTSFFFASPGDRRGLHSFPTRRSSDLRRIQRPAAFLPSVQYSERRRRSEYWTLGKKDRKSTRLNSSHDQISYAVFCLKKKKNAESV